MLAEAAAQLPVVPAVHVAVPVEVEVPQFAHIAGLGPERGPKLLAVRSVHGAIAVRVAEQPGEAVHPVAPRRTVAVPVQLSAEAVVDTVRPDRQGVTAVRQRATDELR